MVYHPKPQITWIKMRENVGEAKGIKNKFNAFNEWINSKRHKGEWTHCTKVGETRNDLCFFSCLALLICWHTIPFSQLSRIQFCFISTIAIAISTPSSSSWMITRSRRVLLYRNQNSGNLCLRTFNQKHGCTLCGFYCASVFLRVL
jgi:hypothetical protein